LKIIQNVEFAVTDKSILEQYLFSG
jgi:hypothetical protein